MCCDGSFIQVINYFVQFFYEFCFFFDFSDGVRNIVSINGFVKFVKNNLWVNFFEIQYIYLYYIVESILYFFFQIFGVEIVFVNVEVDMEEIVVGKNYLKR